MDPLEPPGAPASDALPEPAPPQRVRWRSELAGALGDLGTLLPYLVGFITIAGVDATSVLLAFGLALLLAGWRFGLPMPVQPMKAIGAAALAQAGLSTVPMAQVLPAAALLTGLFWLAAARTGLAGWLARHVSRDVVHGIVLGLGIALILQGLQRMEGDLLVGALAVLACLALLARAGWLLLPLLLAAGVGLGLWRDPAAGAALSVTGLALTWPQPQWGWLVQPQVWLAALALAAAQVPLTLGNAVLGTVAEVRRLFPLARLDERAVAGNTGVMNLLAALLAAPPMCHGAGGLAAHVAFGARSGRAPMAFGLLLVLLALGAAAACTQLLQLLPQAILGALLAIAGLSLAIGTAGSGRDKQQRAVLLATAAVSIWSAGAGLVFGLVFEAGLRRGLFRL